MIANTIIDGGGIASVATFAGTETSSSILTGFTITNGGGVAYSNAEDRYEVSMGYI